MVCTAAFSNHLKNISRLPAVLPSKRHLKGHAQPGAFNCAIRVSKAVRRLQMIGVEGKTAEEHPSALSLPELSGGYRRGAVPVGERQRLHRGQDRDQQTRHARWQGSPKGVVSDQEREDKKAQYAVAIAEPECAATRSPSATASR